MQAQRGFSTIESLIVAAALLLALLTPINDEGLPDPSGVPVTTRLTDNLRANHAAWVYGLSMPDA